MFDIERYIEYNTIVPKFSEILVSALLYKICSPIELEQKIKINFLQLVMAS